MNDIKRSETTEDIYEDVTLMTETVEMDRGERVEMMVDIYESTDTERHYDLWTNTERHQPLQHTGSVSVKNRKHRAVEVCVCLLCVLLLTAVMMLCVYFTTERNQLRAHINNLTEERHQILTKYEQILNHSNNLTEERHQILTKYEQILNHSNNLTEERHQILTKYEQILNHSNTLTEEREQILIKYEQILNHINNLTEEREQIKHKNDELQRGICKQDQRDDNFKWIYCNFSFYYISSEYKIWSDSKRDCQQRGADLVIINSKEEQEFLQKVAGNDQFWIGLRTTQGEWKWINDTTITKGFWRNQYVYNDYCALMTSSGWEYRLCYYSMKWICKRTILKPLIR